MDPSELGPQSDAVLAFLFELSALARDDIYRGMGMRPDTLEGEKAQADQLLTEAANKSAGESEGRDDNEPLWMMTLAFLGAAQRDAPDLTTKTGVYPSEWRTARQAVDKQLAGKLTRDGLPIMAAYHSLVSLIMGNHKLSPDRKRKLYSFEPWVPLEAVERRQRLLTRYGTVRATMVVESLVEALQDLSFDQQDEFLNHFQASYYTAGARSARRTYRLSVEETMQVAGREWTQSSTLTARRAAEEACSLLPRLESWTPPRRPITVLPGTHQARWYERGWISAICGNAGAILAVWPSAAPLREADEIEPVLEPLRTVLGDVATRVRSKEDAVDHLLGEGHDPIASTDAADQAVDRTL